MQRSLTVFSQAEFSFPSAMRALYGFTETHTFCDPFAFIEYVFRKNPDAVLYCISESDDAALSFLHALLALPLERPFHLFLLTDRILPFPIPAAVCDCFQQPIALEMILSRISTMLEESMDPVRNDRLLDRICSEVLLKLGVSPHLQGFEMLRLGAEFILHQPYGANLKMMTELYAKLAEITNTNISIVEHAMRHAIETAWMRADYNVLESFIGYTTEESNPTPSNTAFLYMLSERVRMRLYGRGSMEQIARELHRFDSVS